MINNRSRISLARSRLLADPCRDSDDRSEAKQHARVCRPWGFFETLHLGPGTQVKLIEVNPGAALSLQYHHKRAEHWVVVSGEATIVRGDENLVLLRVGAKREGWNNFDDRIDLEGNPFSGDSVENKELPVIPIPGKFFNS